MFEFSCCIFKQTQQTQTQLHWPVIQVSTDYWPAWVEFLIDLFLLEDEVLAACVTLEHTVEGQGVVPHHLLLHVQDADVRRDPQLLAAKTAQGC